jgi:hypothetical protein
MAENECLAQMRRSCVGPSGKSLVLGRRHRSGLLQASEQSCEANREGVRPARQRQPLVDLPVTMAEQSGLVSER